MKHIDTIALQGSIAEMRYRIASEQGAMHKVRLAVARWRNPVAATHVDADADAVAVAVAVADENTLAHAASPASQLRWHAEAQCQFLCWLEQGGFAHEEAEADSQAAAEAAAATAAAAQGQQLTSKEIMAQAEQSDTPISPAHCNSCTA